MKHSLFFLGYCVDKETAHALSGISIAGNNMQLSILKQLYLSEKFEMHCFTVYPVDSYPSDTNLQYKKATIPIFDGLLSVRVAFVNLPVIKQILQILSLYKNAASALRMNPNATILTFNMYPQIGLPARWLKKKYPKCLLVALMADLPIDAAPNRGLLGGGLYKLFNRITEKTICKADKLIVLNENAAKTYAPGKPYIVMEGGVDAEAQDFEAIPMANREKAIIYSGKLIEYNGVIELLEAMSLIKSDDIKLYVYGDGPLKEKVVSASKTTANVKYIGLVHNDEMKQIQQSAYLLINPRPVDNPIAMMTFPSKIFEYLISGTPVLSTKLNAFTKEYCDKMFFTETNSPREMALKIDEIMNMSPQYLESLAEKARKFVLTQKNWNAQINKVIEFINKESDT